MKFSPLLASFLLASAVAGCGSPEPKTTAQVEETRAKALAKRLKAACSSEQTYDRLKQVAFDEAIRIRNADPVNLDLLSTYSLVRVENPVVKSRDETLDVTVCSGRFILTVPPGAEKAFAGKRQLAADIEYAAQAAADGSGLVYQIKGAEPIIYNLAAFDLKSQAYRPVGPPREETEVAVANAPPARPPAAARTPPEAAPPAPSAPVRTVRPQPVPTPAAQPRPVERAVASAPSFSCRSGRSRSEQMVCKSERLASLDRAMSSQFYAELDRTDGATRAELRRTRDRFLRDRERCGDEACVEQAYRARMDEIASIAGR
jgi:hypothetical protein